jgi:hypothetical protein
MLWKTMKSENPNLDLLNCCEGSIGEEWSGSARFCPKSVLSSLECLHV